MENYLTQIVNDYKDLADELGFTVELDPVPTPLLEEDCSMATTRAPKNLGSPSIDCPHCRHSFAPNASPTTVKQLLIWMKKFTPGCDQNPLATNPKTPNTLKQEDTPEPCAVCLDVLKDPEVPLLADPAQTWDHSKITKPEKGTLAMPVPKAKPAKKFGKIKSKVGTNAKEQTLHQGRLHSIASSMLMRILYAGRMARFDLLRAVNSLACVVAYWNDDADRRLHQLVCYIGSTLKYRQTGWIGDDTKNLAPHDYCDANFAGCPRTLRSTSGIQQQLEGPNSCFPL